MAIFIFTPLTPRSATTLLVRRALVDSNYLVVWPWTSFCELRGTPLPHHCLWGPKGGGAGWAQAPAMVLLSSCSVVGLSMLGPLSLEVWLW